MAKVKVTFVTTNSKLTGILPKLLDSGVKFSVIPVDETVQPEATAAPKPKKRKYARQKRRGINLNHIKAMRTLEKAGHSMGATEIARSIGMVNFSTTGKNMCDEGWLQQVHRRGHYHLTEKAREWLTANARKEPQKIPAKTFGNPPVTTGLEAVFGG